MPWCFCPATSRWCAGAIKAGLFVRLAEWVPPVGGAALSRHTRTWQVQATGRYIGKATGEAEWCPEASSRGDAKQPRGAADRAPYPGG
jgi:hypothetical protein